MTSAAWRATAVRRWLVPLLLLGLPLLAYGRFILGDELANADVFLAYRPAHGWLAAGLREGRLPLWNPYLLGGFPLAFSEYGWFSPLNWAPLLLLGPHAGYYTAVALYVGLSGMAAYALARAWGAGQVAALLAGAIFGQSLLVVGGAPLLNQGAAYWALPCLLWLTTTHFRGSRTAAPAVGAVGALLLLGSHPQQAIIAGLPVALFAGYIVARERTARSVRALVPLLLAGAAGAGVAAVRLLPTVALLGASSRAGGLDFGASTLGSVTPLALLAGLTLPSLDLPFGLLRPQWTAYVGPLPLLLALIGLRAAWRRAPDAFEKRRGPDRPWPFVAGLGLTGTLLALGANTPLYWALARTPLLTYFREPSRFLLWTVLAVAVLAAWGLDAVRPAPAPRAPRPGALWWAGALLVLVMIAGTGTVHAVLQLNERTILNTLRVRAMSQARSGDYPVGFYVEGADAGWRQALRATDVLSPGLLVPLGALLAALWWWRWGRWWPEARTLGLLLCVLPLVLYGAVRLPGIPASVVRETPESVAIVRAAGGAELPADAPALTPRAYAWLPLATDFEARRQAEALGQHADIVSFRLLKTFLTPNFGTTYAVPVIDGYENLMTREQALLVAALGSERAGTAGEATETGLTRLGLQERRLRLGQRWSLLAAAGTGTVLSADRLRPETWPATVRYDRAAVSAADGVPALNAYRFVRPLPRAFVVDGWAVAAGPVEAIGRILGAPPGTGGDPPVVVVPPAGEAPPRPRRVPGARPDDAGDAGDAGLFEARIVRYDERVVEVETEADGDALLVLLDANAPGWTATVTGAPASLLTANVAFRAVAIPAGRHLVRFSYTPPAWDVARGVSLLALLALGLWGARSWWQGVARDVRPQRSGGA